MFRRTRLHPAWRYNSPGYKRDFYWDHWVRDKYEKHFAELFSHQVFGYTLRVLAVCSLGTIGFLTGRRLLLWADEGTPLAHRQFQRWVPVTFIDRTQEGNSDVHVYRFALPNSYDYTGHECFSSCQINLRNHPINPIKRYYTPINHPEQRGIIEFAIKHYDPGELTMQLRYFQPGETCYIGKWLKEMKYIPNKYEEIGFIAGNSGITPFLQMLTFALANPEDKTKFSLLFANYGPHVIPFKQKLLSVQERFPDRLKVTFVVQQMANSAVSDGEEVTLPRASRGLKELGTPLSQVANPNPSGATNALLSGQDAPSAMVYDDSLREVRCTALKATGANAKQWNYDGYVGFVDRDLILETMPWPTDGDKSKILVCGPPRMLGNLCGRSVPVLRQTYLEGVFDGLMRQMGYQRSQVYKFGYTFHPRGLDT